MSCWWLCTKQFLPSIVVKIALSMQPGRAETLRKGKHIESRERKRDGREEGKKEHRFMKKEKKWRTCVVHSRGAHDFSFPRRVVKIARVQPHTRCSWQTRGRITAIIIRLMPCKLSGRERSFAWFYAHFTADAWSLSTSHNYRDSSSKRSRGLRWNLLGFFLYLKFRKQLLAVGYVLKNLRISQTYTPPNIYIAMLHRFFRTNLHILLYIVVDSSSSTVNYEVWDEWEY